MAIAINGAGTITGLTAGGLPDASVATADIAADAIDGTKLADNACDSEHYTDGSIDLVHLQTGTDGELITWDASGNPAAVAVGTSTHVLTSGGAGVAPTFQAPAAGGGLIHLQSQTASTSASIAWSSTYITSTYKTYVIYASDIMPATDGAIFEVHYSENNGSSYLTSGYGFVIDGIDHAGNNAGYSGGSATDADLTFEIDSGTMGVQGNIGMHFVLSDPSTANNCSHLAAMGSYRDNADTLIVSSTVVGHNAATNAVNNIKFEMSSGTISTGYFSLFGVSTG
jgi:hypothetical protein